MFLKMVLCDIFQNSKESICAGVYFLIKLQAWYATLLKVRFVHKYLLLSFKECHKILFLQNNSVRLLLIFSSILEATYLTLS